MRGLDSLLVLCILVGVSVIGVITTASAISEPRKTSANALSLSGHDPIYIVGNSGFISGGWPGDGSESSPFVIESLEIVSESTCITIRNADAHFIIRNCTLSSPISGEGTGISFAVIDNGLVENCTISSLDTGIQTYITNNCRFTNNTIIDCSSNGLDLAKDINCTVDNNMVRDHSGYGVYVALNEFSCIENNSILNCKETGLEFAGSINTTIVGNEVEESGRYGIYIASSENCTFINNTLMNGGFGVGWLYDYDWTHDFSGNMVNGKALGYFIETSNTDLDGSQFGQVFLVDCFNVSLNSGAFFNASIGVSLFSCTNCTINDTEIGDNLDGVNLIQSENTMMTNNSLVNCGVRFEGTDLNHWKMTAVGNTVNGKQFGYFNNHEDLAVNGNDYGQFILVDSNRISITNGTFDTVTVGFVAYSSFNCNVSDASFINNYYEGISLLKSNNITLTNVTSTGSQGRGLYNGASNNTVMTKSRIHGNAEGIEVYTSDNFLFDSNHIYNIQSGPLGLWSTNYGIVRNNSIHDNAGRFRIYKVNWLEVINNTISRSSVDGIYMDYTSGVVIAGNKIYGNDVYGLNVRSNARYSKIYNNMIGFNGAGNAHDAGSFNEWDDGKSIGNIWSDYSGTGVYSIERDGVDNYPLGFLTWQEDIEYIVGSIVPSITWDVRLPNPDSYTLLWEGSSIAQGSLNSSLDHISKSIESLEIGNYNLTIIVADESGYSLVDTVLITVVDKPGTTTTTTTTTTSPTTMTNTTSPTGTLPQPDGPSMFIMMATGVIGLIVIVVLIVIRKK